MLSIILYAALTVVAIFMIIAILGYGFYFLKKIFTSNNKIIQSFILLSIGGFVVYNGIKIFIYFYNQLS